MCTFKRNDMGMGIYIYSPNKDVKFHLEVDKEEIILMIIII